MANPVSNTTLMGLVSQSLEREISVFVETASGRLITVVPRLGHVGFQSSRF